jgi:hypothetical protein
MCYDGFIARNGHLLATVGDTSSVEDVAHILQTCLGEVALHVPKTQLPDWTNEDV